MPCGLDCPLRFTVSEHKLFSRQFTRFSVTPSQFKRLIDATTSWDKIVQGDIIVRKGETIKAAKDDIQNPSRGLTLMSTFS